MAIKPYFQEETGLETFRKAKAMKKTMVRDTRMIAIMAFPASCRPTDGPMEL